MKQFKCNVCGNRTAFVYVDDFKIKLTCSKCGRELIEERVFKI